MNYHPRIREAAHVSRGILATTVLLFGWQSASIAFADFIGTRSTSTGGIIADDGWSIGNGGFRIDFSVSQVGPLWRYDYVFKDANGTGLDPNITRFIKLEVSQNVPSAVHQLISDGSGVHNPGDLITLTPQAYSFHLWDAPASDPSYDLFSVFVGDDNDNLADELSDDHISFLSTQGPMWGSFYVRDGHDESTSPAEAINRGFNGGVFPNPLGGTFSQVNGGNRPTFNSLQDPNTASLNSWILVPDTFTTVNVPEPTSFVLILPALVVACVYGRRARVDRADLLRIRISLISRTSGFISTISQTTRK